MKIHLSATCFWLILAVLLINKVCIPSEAFEVSEYDGSCVESDHNYCGTDDAKSIQISSAYDVIASFATSVYNSVLKFTDYFGLRTIKLVLDDPSIIVWKFWITILEIVEKYFPHFLSFILLFLATVINILLWYIRVPFLYIVRFDAILFFIYSCFGPKFVLEYFPWLLSASYNVLYVLVISYPFYTAVVFLLLSYHKVWTWIPRKMMKSAWINDKIVVWITTTLNVSPPIKTLLSFMNITLTRRRTTEQLLLDMQETQHTLMENQKKILQVLQILEQKCQASNESNDIRDP